MFFYRVGHGWMSTVDAMYSKKSTKHETQFF